MNEGGEEVVELHLRGDLTTASTQLAADLVA
jgi:hypothetical protein